MADAQNGTWVTTTKRQKFFHRIWVQRLIGRCLAGYLQLIFLTGRWRCDFHPDTVAMISRGDIGIGIFWHGRLAMVPLIWRRLCDRAGRPKSIAHAMISLHGDGGLIAAVLEPLGVPGVRGSSGKSGAKVAREAISTLGDGDCLAIAVDGPRGPATVVQPGAAFIARQAAVPVVPITFAAAPALTFKSWDRLTLPWPFARGVLLVGPPIPSAFELGSREALRLELEDRLNRLTARAVTMLNGADENEPGAQMAR